MSLKKIVLHSLIVIFALFMFAKITIGQIHRSCHLVSEKERSSTCNIFGTIVNPDLLDVDLRQ